MDDRYAPRLIENTETRFFFRKKCQEPELFILHLVFEAPLSPNKVFGENGTSKTGGDPVGSSIPTWSKMEMLWSFGNPVNNLGHIIN